MARDAERFLKRIIPYLVSKREQAELALMFRATFRNKVGYCGLGTPAEIIQLRETYFKKMKELHGHKKVSNEHIQN